MPPGPKPTKKKGPKERRDYKRLGRKPKHGTAGGFGRVISRSQWTKKDGTTGVRYNAMFDSLEGGSANKVSVGHAPTEAGALVIWNNYFSRFQAGEVGLPKQRKTTSRHTGVTWNKAEGKWQAQIGVRYKRRYLGLFEDEDEAGREYDRAAIRERGAGAKKLNFPLSDYPKELAAFAAQDV